MRKEYGTPVQSPATLYSQDVPSTSNLLDDTQNLFIDDNESSSEEADTSSIHPIEENIPR
jgi:hypothetical protein